MYSVLLSKNKETIGLNMYSPDDEQRLILALEALSKALFTDEEWSRFGRHAVSHRQIHGMSLLALSGRA